MCAYHYKFQSLFPIIFCGLICLIIVEYINTKFVHNKMNISSKVSQNTMNISNKYIHRENKKVFILSNETAEDKRSVNWTWFHLRKFMSKPISNHVVTKKQVIYSYY